MSKEGYRPKGNVVVLAPPKNPPNVARMNQTIMQKSPVTALNAVDLYAFNQYANLNPQDAAAVDSAFTAAQNALRAHGRFCSDGPKISDILVAGIMRYLIESSKVSR